MRRPAARSVPKSSSVVSGVEGAACRQAKESAKCWPVVAPGGRTAGLETGLRWVSVGDVGEMAVKAGRCRAVQEDGGVQTGFRPGLCRRCG